tara:strand:+ start:1383 stop:2429 length:1047 start_codon:yes stop_codon:yes gene_type:complete
MPYTPVNKSTANFNTKLYAGNGAAIGSGGNAQTGVGFQPDWVWIKDRSTTNHHNLFDAVRGVTKGVQSSQNIAEYTNTETVTAFGTDGFTVGNAGGVNTNSNNYVSWNWKAGNSAGSSNTDGSVTSTVSANTTAGFSICKFSFPGSGNFTVGHGLGVAPRVIIMKGLGTANWQVYHEGLGNTFNTQLNYTNAASSAANWWGSTSPTSTVFTVGADLVESGQDGIAYCFAEKIGYSRFGTYSGNGNNNGAFIYTGFKPAWILIKQTSGSNLQSWWMIDAKRDPFNVCDENLRANANSAASQSYDMLDILSNGFKLRWSDTAINGSGTNYIYLAFGQSIVGSNNVPATAR